MKKIISWVEIPAADFDRAVKFYNAVFSLEMEAISLGDEKMACFPTGDGAISFAPGIKPSREGTLVSLDAGGDIEAVLKRIEHNGGEIIKGKTKIEADDLGYFALFVDTEGNKVGLYSEA